MKKLFRRLLAWLHSLRRRDKVMYIGGSDTLPPPLPREEETEVIARLEQGDPQARQTLIERNLRLVVYIAPDSLSPLYGKRQRKATGKCSLSTNFI